MASTLAFMCRQIAAAGVEPAVSMCSKHNQIVVTALRCLSSQYPRHQPVTPPPPSPSDIITRDVDGFQLTSIGGPHPRPLAVLIGWLNAKRKHLYKYQELYWTRGFDVLTMDVAPVHIVRPRTGIQYTSKLLRALQENEELSSRQVVFHGFSIGAFIYTQLQLLLQQQQLKQQQELPPELGQMLLANLETPWDLGPRIAGLVLDSPAYMDHMCNGIANSLTSNPLARSLINNSLLLYLAAFPRSVTFHYQESHRMFHDNSVPTLLLYSSVDLISSASTSENYAREWREKGFPVFTREFPDSNHVNHFRQYPREYEEAVDAFLHQLDLQHTKVAEVVEEAPMARQQAAAVAEV